MKTAWFVARYILIDSIRVIGFALIGLAGFVALAILSPIFLFYALGLLYSVFWIALSDVDTPVGHRHGRVTPPLPDHRRPAPPPSPSGPLPDPRRYVTSDRYFPAPPPPNVSR